MTEKFRTEEEALRGRQQALAISAKKLLPAFEDGRMVFVRDGGVIRKVSRETADDRKLEVVSATVAARSDLSTDLVREIAQRILRK